MARRHGVLDARLMGNEKRGQASFPGRLVLKMSAQRGRFATLARHQGIRRGT
ncbi:hypothetical protein BOSEA31B_13769 [Hyphomicrobiales bacterium]|nr:hypothetical protein BOSEA31B_13769 [Hyphomicrobiales bacterium]CAI0343327.1 hypothetical protein BO1005MUT1_220126 [Hyphomicrobiales bacterium]